MNPYASLNDGMVDITWISDPAAMTMSGIGGMLDKAGKRGGIQAYDHTSKYMRGKKISVKFTGKNVARPRTDYGEQLFGIDGEDLRYHRKITWECIPRNIQVMFDHETFFTEYESFIEQDHQIVDPDQFSEGELHYSLTQLQKYQKRTFEFEEMMQEFFTEFDDDKNGYLDHDELRRFLNSFF